MIILNVIKKEEPLKEIKENINEEEELVAPSFDFSNMKFGLDALDEEFSYDEISTMDSYETTYGLENAEDIKNYVKETDGKIMTDEEIEDIVCRFTRIQDRKSNAFNIVMGMIKDFRKCVKSAASKHGSWVFDTDEYDEEKDKVRMLTKSEATLIIDTVLAERLPTYVLALENFRKESKRTFGFVVLGTIIMFLLMSMGFVVILPIVVFFGSFTSVGNTLALIRDMKRTRLVIVKEIDRIQRTIASLDKTKDGDRIKDLTAVMAVLMKSSGYDEKDPKWKKLRDPEVVKKIMESIDYFGADVYGIDEIRINILEADMDDTLDDRSDNTQKEEKPAVSDDESNNTENEDNSNNEDNYGGVNAEDVINDLENKSSFSDGGNDNEKEYKLKYVLSNIDELLNKYTMLYNELVASDPYKVIMNDENHKNKDLLEILRSELEMAINSLNEYIHTGDKSTYAIVALKHSTFQQLLVGINDELLKIIKKDMEEESKLNK